MLIDLGLRIFGDDPRSTAQINQRRTVVCQQGAGVVDNMDSDGSQIRCGKGVAAQTQNRGKSPQSGFEFVVLLLKITFHCRLRLLPERRTCQP